MPVRPKRKTFVAVALAASTAMVVPTIVSVAGSSPAGAATAAASSVDPSGVKAPQWTPPGYVKRFVDDFGTEGKLNGFWSKYSGEPGGDPAGYWDPSHVRVTGGMLVLDGYKDSTPYGTRLVTGGVSTRGTVSQKYGRFEVRMKMAKGKGVSYALLTWPSNQSGPPEIDFAEDNGAGDRSEVSTFVHYGTKAVKQQVRRSLRVDMSQWHTIGMQWGPNRINYLLDGRVWSTVTGSNVVSHLPMFLALQTQAWPCGLSYQNCASSDPKVTPSKISMYVDWVAIWRPKAGTVPA